MPRHVLAAAFLIGLLAQIAVLPLLGTSDVRTFKEWAVSSLSHGLLSSYAAPDPLPSTYARPDYPPLSVTLLAGVAAVIDVVTGRVDPASRALTFYIKLMVLTAHLALSGLVLWLVGKYTRDGTKASLWALMYFVNPALMMNAAVLGYLDSLCLLFGLLAIVNVSMRNCRTAAMLAVIAAMIKPQGVFFLLPVAVAAWGSRQIRQITVAAMATGAAILLPFVLASGPVNFLRAMAPNALDATLSGNALNFWWLVTIAMRSMHSGWEVFSIRISWLPYSIFTSATGIDPRLWMALAVLGVAAWCGWLTRGASRLPALAAYLALVIHVYFVLAIGVHENHQVYVVALLLLVAPTEPAYRRLTAAVSLLVASNMVLFYGFGRDFPEIPRLGPFLLVTVALSIANIALLAVHVKLFREFCDRMPGPVESPADRSLRGLAGDGGLHSMIAGRFDVDPKHLVRSTVSRGGLQPT